MSEALILFTRYPVENRVKTRMIPEIGSREATRIHSCLAKHALRTLKQYCQLAGSNAPHLFVFFDGGDQAGMLVWLGHDLYCLEQNGRDLGERMDHALQHLFSRGYDRVVLVGSDCPGLHGKILGEALQALSFHDVALGPALDGGYYLIGLRRPCSDLFHDMAWSTPRVCKETLQHCGAAGLRVHLLPVLSDVDSYEDWKRCCQSVAQE